MDHMQKSDHLDIISHGDDGTARVMAIQSSRECESYENPARHPDISITPKSLNIHDQYAKTFHYQSHQTWFFYLRMLLSTLKVM